MRFIMIVIAVLTVAAFPAIAAENGIITINPDGTITDSDNPQARHDAAKAAVIRAEKINPPEPEGPVKDVIKPGAEEPKPQPRPEPVKVKPVVKKPAVAKKAEPAPVNPDAQPAEVKPEPEPKAEPAKTPAPKAAAKPKKKQAVAPVKEETKAEPAPPKIKWNKPPKKKPKSVAIEPVEAPVPVPAAPAGPITRDEALRAAIQVAPPFKRSNVMRGNYQGKPVYEVILQTEEEGQETILVDAMTGAIIKGH